ncbi:MAG: ABC transporter ATP-binding protein [Pseudomonadota bacterium]
MSVIEINNLTKDFRADFWKKKVRVLHDLSFTVNKNEIFGFLGLNGAGKSTTIKILMGILYPTFGSATILGKKIGHVATKDGIGFLPENPYFYEYLTAYEFLNFHGKIFKISHKQRAKKADELLELVGMTHAKDVPLRRFSKGMLQRIGLAQALVNDPDLVVLDEPQSGLDPIGRKDVRDIILNLKDNGKTVFFSSHILPDVEMICDRIAIIHKGKLVDVGYVGDLINPQILGIEIVFDAKTDFDLEPMKSFTNNISRNVNRINVEVDSEDKLKEVLSFTSKNHLPLVSVTRHKETLEDIFLKKVEVI